VSTLLEQPSAVPADPPAPTTRRGSLLRAELHRFRSRRFLQVLLGLSVLGWIVATVVALTQFGVPTDSDRADARAQIDQLVAEQQVFREQCLDDPEGFYGGPVPEGMSTDEVCGPPMTAADFRVEDFIGKAPFDLAGMGTVGAVAFAAAAAVVAFIMGATWIGAEWSSRSLVALLFWVPQRQKVMATKIAVLVLGAALFGVLAQAGWLLMAWILRSVVGTDDALPDDFWGELLGLQGRSVLLTVLIALLGFGLTNLVRNTGAALGIGFVYFAVLETALRGFRPSWEPWLLSTNAAGLLAPGGLEVPDYGNLTVTPEGLAEPSIYVLTNLQAGIFLTAVAALIVGAGVVLFTRRDVH
jgi:hypothetical protein